MKKAKETTPAKAFNAIKVLQPSVLHIKHNRSGYVVAVLRDGSKIGYKTNISWPESMTEYPPSWRKATPCDGSFRKPVPCRVRDIPADKWVSGFLVIVSDDPLSGYPYICRRDDVGFLTEWAQCDVPS